MTVWVIYTVTVTVYQVISILRITHVPMLELVARGNNHGSTTFWHGRFGAADSALRRFVAETFWRWKDSAPIRFGAETIRRWPIRRGRFGAGRSQMFLVQNEKKLVFFLHKDFLNRT